MAPPPPAFQVLDRLLAGEVHIREFERWVYASPELEQALGPDDSFELLAFHYGQRHARHELCRLVEGIYERRRPGMIVGDRVWRLACALARDAGDFPRAVHGIANFWYEGHEWIPIDFVGISSELDDIADRSEQSPDGSRTLATRDPEWDPHVDALRGAASAAASELLRSRYPDAPCG